MPQDLVGTRVESLGEFIVNAEHTFPRTDQGYDGERWIYYEEGQITEQVFSLALNRWTVFGAIQFQDVQLTAANILDLIDTNITLVTAPPAGTTAIPTRAHLYHDHGGTDFIQAAGSDALAIKYAASTEITELGSEAQMTAFIEAAADAALHVPISSVFVPVAASALVIDNNGATEYTTGDGTFSVRTHYVIEPMAAFS